MELFTPVDTIDGNNDPAFNVLGIRNTALCKSVSATNSRDTQADFP
jgi:hypothetical protein